LPSGVKRSITVGSNRASSSSSVRCDAGILRKLLDLLGPERQAEFVRLDRAVFSDRNPGANDVSVSTVLKPDKKLLNRIRLHARIVG
jgi:hypothetical protein